MTGAAGKPPVVTFTVKDNAGNGIPMASLTGGSNRLALVMAGPTTDYGYTNFGSDVTTPGYVSEDPVPTATCSQRWNLPIHVHPLRFRRKPPAPTRWASKAAAA